MWIKDDGIGQNKVCKKGFPTKQDIKSYYTSMRNDIIIVLILFSITIIAAILVNC